MKFSIKITLTLLLLFTLNINSQNSFADCSDAIAVCETATQNYNVLGIGNINDLPTTPSGCLDDGGNGTGIESNSIWFRFKAARSGEVGFNIIPENPNDDWDFALYGPNVTCDNLGDPVGWSVLNCGISNYAGDNPNDGGMTGAGNPPSAASAGWYTPYFTVTAGEEYFLLINSFRGGNDRFTLEWTGRLVNDGGGNPLDCSIVTGDLGADQEVCEGTTITLDGTPITGTADTYEWFLDTGAGFNPISGQTNATLVINNNVSGIYKVVVTDTDGNMGEDEVEITFFEVPVATQPTNINFCDADGTNTFNLSAEKDTEILNGLSIDAFEVVYFNSMTDANNNTNPITTYTNSSSLEETIYARVHNKGNNTCFDITNFTIQVSIIPVASNPTTYRFCDNTSAGTDTDGFVNDFLLSTKDNEILGSLDPTQFNVSYHTTLTGAQTNATTDVIDKTVNYTNIVANQQPIYVRVENNDNTTCFDASKTFDLIVDPLPVTNALVELKQCDNDIDGFSAFNLYEVSSDISDNHLNETFTFFLTLADANANTNELTPAEAQAFTNRTILSDTVWARATNNLTCYRISEVILTVSTTGIPLAFQRSFSECDDFLDIDGNDTSANDDTDGITTFDFSSVTPEILSLFPVGQSLTVTYYRNEADALAEINPITDPSNYRNIGYPNSQVIYVRIDSDADNDCVGFGPHVILNVDPVPTANPVSNLELCDDLDDGDGTNGINISFDLESQTPTILGTQDPANYTVTYHASVIEANTGTNPLSSPYTNTTRDRQTIYVRVSNNGCFTDHTTFDLIVHPVPIANFVQNLEVCDDDSDGSARNGFSQSIDLESQTPGILGSQDPTVFSVTYHKSLAQAQAGINPLASPFSNETPYRETIYIRVYNTTTMCTNGISNFDVIINPEPTTAPVSNLSYCDDATDGNDMNGIIQSIDLDSQIEGVLGTIVGDPTTQQPDDFNVTFHASQAEATSGANPIASPYTNTNTTETIFVRVENKATSCVNDDASFQVIVNSLPNFSVITPDIACLNILPKFLNAIRPSDVYTYQWTNPNGDLISITDTAEVSVINGEVLAGNYTVRATTTDGTMCSRERIVVVNTSNIATITDDDVTIIDQSNTTSNDNLSIQINNNNQNLGIGKYQYALEDENGILIRNYQDEPLFENLEGGIYNILVNDINGCGAVNLWVSVLEFPKFFTPNFDGRNDTWIIKGANRTFYPESSIHIFNRFGKIMAQVALDSQGWDGTYNGKALPSDDYWFHIQLVPVNTNRNPISKKGHFSLVRR